MSRDRELPQQFEKLNPFGVPNAGLIVATVIPAILVIVVRDVSGLADLYAVGVVGAIATNLGASSTDKKLGLRTWERTLMFSTFIVMAAIEVSLFVDKPNARLFAATILVFGLILRGLASERAEKKALIAAAADGGKKGELSLPLSIRSVRRLVLQCCALSAESAAHWISPSRKRKTPIALSTSSLYGNNR